MKAYFREHPAATAASAILLIITVASALAPWVAPHDPYDLLALDILDAEIPPVWSGDGDPRFLLGTDAQGRDILSAILYGAGISLSVGVLAVVLQGLIGLTVGFVAGYAGGRLDGFLMRLADVQLSLSTLMVAIIALALVQTAFGAERFGTYAVPMLVLVIGLAEWPHFARTARGSVLAEKQKPYVLAAQALGQTPLRIVIRHILPNVSSPLMILATIQVANAIMAEAALSFLGLGMPVTQPSLGSLIRSGFELLMAGSWWITLLPAAVLVSIILAINLIGDALRDRLNPRLGLIRLGPRHVNERG